MNLIVLIILIIFVPLYYLKLIENGREIEAEAKKIAIPNIYNSIIAIISVVMKSNGKPTRSELLEVKSYLLKKYGEARAKKLLAVLKEMLDKRITNIKPYCLSINRNFTYKEKLEFMVLLFQVASKSEGICDYEANILEQIAKYTTIRKSDMLTLRGKFESKYRYTWQNRGTNNREGDRSTGTKSYTTSYKWTYDELNITEQASNDEIKKSYRKLAMKYHPDKVFTTDPQVKQQTAEKFRRITEAYNIIRKIKNI